MSTNKSGREDSKILAVVPARGGSKGVKNKNIRDVCGKPLIYYQIMNGLKSKLIDCLVLATDEEHIADLAKSIFGNKIEIVIRPPEISHDLSKTEETLIYVINQLSEHGNDFNLVVTLEPTNPLNRPEYVDNCIKMVTGQGYDSACCATEDYGFFLDGPENLKQLIDRPMRQKMKPRMRETGNCWATKIELLLKEKNRLGGEVGFVKIPVRDSYHLDTEDDWRIIESLLRSRQLSDKTGYFKARFTGSARGDYEEEYWCGVVDPDGAIRDKIKERQKRIRECREEIDYINSLKPGRALDVGCGLGFLLSAIDNNWEKYGVDVSSFAAERAREYGEIFCGTLKEANYEPDFFDVVVLYHVIEHIKDPVGELAEARRILKPYGKLIVGTPDFECGLAKRFGKNFRLYHDKTHISLFSTLGLYNLLTDLLFEVERLSCPYFETEHFTEENLLRLFDTDKISPPFYGNVVTFYAYKK
ncbi:MAG: hypothetical protein SRB1_02446 [Desulfobacteraceae bacterium Eth-SRB1]|nr:MAG: hypothetical protein SRB1_02446 [Desulfobacteraceae bacterium Eth-SRB1]